MRGHGSEDVLPQGKRSLLPVVDCLSLMWKKFHVRLSESPSIEFLVFFHNKSLPGVRQPPPLPHLLIPRPETDFHRPLNGQLLPHGVGGGTFVKPISLCVAGGHQGAWLQHHQLRTGVVGDSHQDGQVPSLKSKTILSKVGMIVVQRMMQLVCVKNVHNRLEELGLDGTRVRRELTNPLYSVSLNPEQKMD